MDKLVESLYSESELRKPIAKTERKKLWKRVGRRLGCVPYTKKFEPGEIDEPTYLNFGQVLSKYFRKVSKKIGDYFADRQGVVPYTGKDTKIAVRKLPTKWATFVDNTGNVYRAIIGKIYGFFSPKNDTIYTDPVNFPELKDPEKDYLRASGMPVNKGERVLGEELFHSYQEKAGSFKKYPISVIEGEANINCDKIFGRMGSYPKEIADYKREYGEKHMITDFRPLVRNALKAA
jgi:hypothetical protein